MVRLFAIPVAMALLISPVLAGEGLVCFATVPGTSAGVPLGGGQGISPLSAEIESGGRLWSTDPLQVGAIPILIGQAFGDDESIRLDFTDDNSERVVAKLRLFVGGSDDVIAGTLWLEDIGAFAVVC
ncbi:MAG: hypothetical protein JWR75_540 [Devosia sp.]|nr:hypothetical protein [Devosia sp.]